MVVVVKWAYEEEAVQTQWAILATDLLAPAKATGNIQLTTLFEDVLKMNVTLARAMWAAIAELYQKEDSDLDEKERVPLAFTQLAYG